MAGGPTILLAEDNEANVQTIGGYPSTTARHVVRDERLVVVKLGELHRPHPHGHPDAGDDGRAPSARSARTQRCATFIVALTALAMPGDRERCPTPAPLNTCASR